MREISLRELCSRLSPQETLGDMQTTVRGIAYDSREVQPGFLFVAMDGLHADGHSFIPDALRRGAAAVVCSRPPSPPADGITYIRVAEPRASLSPLAAVFFGDPSREIKVIGVTGTDGKSTTVWFITQLLASLGRPTGFLSTVSFQVGEEIVKNPFRQSTPEATEIHGMLREMVEIGKEFAVVESTSHGLSSRMNRLGDVVFDAGVFTNVTHEHLEFHGTFERYRSDKANLFRALSRDARKSDPRTGGELPVPRFGVVNADDPSAGYFRQCAQVPVYSYGMNAPADLAASIVSSEITGSVFRMSHAGRSAQARIAIPGPFWVADCLAACLTVARILDIDPLGLADAMGGLRGVKGRMDYVDEGQPFAVIVDYAHTPGAFQGLFPWIREHATGAVTAVFGSAGERDREKRRMQGSVASALCDRVILTNEDPRGEDPMQIIEQIAEGCEGKKRGEDLLVIPDREEAIRRAVALARPGDVVLLLGKGHEGNIFGPKGSMAWDERAEAQKALRAAGYGR